MAPVASVVSIEKGHYPNPRSSDPMRTKKTEEEEEGLLDFDLEKLFRGEVGPNVAEELAAK